MSERGQDRVVGAGLSLAGAWRWLTSMKAAVVLLLVFAGACVLGAVVPQGQPAHFYQRAYGPALGRVVTALDLGRLYSASWFAALAGSLSLSLILCSARRVRAIWQRTFAPSIAADLVQVERMAETVRFHRAGEPRALAADLAARLRRARYRTWTGPGPSDGAVCILARSGAARQWGPFLTHVAILAIIAGAVYGNLPDVRVGRWLLWRTRAWKSVV